METPVRVRNAPSPIVRPASGESGESVIHSMARPSISCCTAVTVSLTRVAPSSSDRGSRVVGAEGEQRRTGVRVLAVVHGQLAATAAVGHHGNPLAAARLEVVAHPDAGQLGLAHLWHTAILALAQAFWRLRRQSAGGRQSAEGVGFEPTVGCPTHAFQACRFGRSRTPPWAQPGVDEGYRTAIVTAPARAGGQLVGGW